MISYIIVHTLWLYVSSHRIGLLEYVGRDQTVTFMQWSFLNLSPPCSVFMSSWLAVFMENKIWGCDILCRDHFIVAPPSYFPIISIFLYYRLHDHVHLYREKGGDPMPYAVITSKLSPSPPTPHVYIIHCIRGDMTGYLDKGRKSREVIIYLMQ